MLFTKEMIEEIRDRLSRLGIKDTQIETLDQIHFPITGEETVVIVKNGRNVKITLNDLYSHFPDLAELIINLQKEGSTDIFNVSAYLDKSGATPYVTLEEAIASVPEDFRKIGLCITFANANNEWGIWQYTGTTLNSWSNVSNWRSTEATEPTEPEKEHNILPFDGFVTIFNRDAISNQKYTSSSQVVADEYTIVAEGTINAAEKFYLKVGDTYYTNWEITTEIPITPVIGGDPLTTPEPGTVSKSEWYYLEYRTNKLFYNRSNKVVYCYNYATLSLAPITNIQVVEDNAPEADSTSNPNNSTKGSIVVDLEHDKLLTWDGNKWKELSGGGSVDIADLPNTLAIENDVLYLKNVKDGISTVISQAKLPVPEDGENGQDGKSAYELAKQENPNVGTLQDWLASLKGVDGFNGKSAYEVWRDWTDEYGSQPNKDKTEEEFLASLKDSDYKMQAVTARPSTIAEIEADKIYLYPDGTGQFSTAIYTGDLESSYDSTKWVVLATNPGDLSGAFTDISGLRADVNNLSTFAETVGDIVGHNEPVTTYNNGYRISSTGAVTSGQNYAKSSTRISVRKGDVVHATGAADSNHDFAVIAKAEGTKRIPLAVMTDTEVREYIVTIQQDCEVVISGLNAGEGAVSAYVERVGTLEDKVMSSVLTDAYTREDILPKDHLNPIPVSAGDIIYFNCPVRNNDLVIAYNENRISLRVMMRFGNNDEITPFSYTVTGTDGIHYMAFFSGVISASGYILRKKPLSAVVKDDIYEKNYATVGDAGVTSEVASGSTSSFINNKGLIVADSTNQGGRIYKIDNTEHKYKSVSVVSKSLYNYYVIAFYNGEPSENTFLPIYSKNFGEQDPQFVGITASNADKDVYNYTALVPDDAVYIRICVRVAGTNALQRSYFRLYYNVDSVNPVNDIRDNFKEKYDKYLLPFNYQHRTPEYLENDYFSSFKQVDFRFLFYTDLHSNWVNLDRILYLGDYLYDKGMLDCIIAGGDNIQDAQNDFSWFFQRVGASKVDNLVAVGNHDASTVWHATKELAYNNNIAPVLERVDNIVTPSDSASAYRMYYYKDYGKVRVIVLYTPPQGDNNFADDSQLGWLQNVLADAKTNSKHVIIVNHHYFNDLYYKVGDNWKYSNIGDWWRSNPNTFTCPFGKGSSFVDTNFVLPTEFLLAVKEFEDAGGVFICWLTGHGHRDNFYDVNDHETYGYQPMFNSASCSTKHTAWQFIKKRGTDSMDCFNYITVDCTQNLIKILRLGANVDVWGRNVTTLVYNYAEHCIVSNN